jgi:hypothetical protein
MSWTCSQCGATQEDVEPEDVQFCQGCGEPTDPAVLEDRAARLDRLLRLMMTVFGGIWLALFFVPYGERGYGGVVMSWDLLENREGMAHLVAWPLVIALMFLVLGLVKPLPAWLRHGAGLVIGVLALGVLFGTDLGGPFSGHVAFLFAGGAPWVLMFAAVGCGLLMRVRVPRSIGARVLIGLGLLLGVVAYLTGAMGESTLVGALLYQLGQGGASLAITRVLMLLPLFLLLVACVGFRLPDAEGDPVRGWSKVTGVGMLIYLPALMLLYGLLLSAAEDTVWHFVMYFKLSTYVAGFLAILAVAAAWTADYATRHVIPTLSKQSGNKSS